jgi:putative ABC transport system permease protein
VSKINTVAAVPGVAAVSPQIFLESMFDSPCCSVSEMFIVAYDPATDFTLRPWLQQNMGRSLNVGEVIGGTYIFASDPGNHIKLYGYETDLKGIMKPTGTGIDQTLFMSVATAQALSASSGGMLKIDPGSISTVLVQVSPGVDPHRVALDIQKDTDVVALESPQLFGAFRNQMNGLLWGFLAITVIIWAVTMLLIGINFSMAANERRREMAVLRCLGATRGFIFRCLLTEAVMLALAGSAAGISVAAAGLYLFRNLIAGSLKMPFLFPSFASFAGMFSAGVGLAVVTVTLAVLLPAVRLSRQELAIAMRE